MIDRDRFRSAILRWLSTAPGPVRLTTVIKQALKADPAELLPQDWATVSRALKRAGWRRHMSEGHGNCWHRPLVEVAHTMILQKCESPAPTTQRGQHGP
jgi:hypothetical protein